MASATCTELLEAVRTRLVQNPSAGARPSSTYSDTLSAGTVLIGAGDDPPPGPHNTYAMVSMLSATPVHPASGNSLHRFAFRVAVYNRMRADRAGDDHYSIANAEAGIQPVCDSIDQVMVHSFLDGAAVGPVMLASSSGPQRVQSLDGQGWLRATRDFSCLARIDRDLVTDTSNNSAEDRG